MERVRLLMVLGLILSVVVFLSVAAAADQEGEPNGLQPEAAGAPEEALVPVEEVRGPAEPQDVNAAVDANSFEARVERGWTEIEQAADSEARGWMALEMDKRIEFTRTAQRATEAQLQLLRLIAESEGATKTVAAIEKILEAKSTKVEEVLDETREARRQERIKQREERRKALEEKLKSRREQTSQP